MGKEGCGLFLDSPFQLMDRYVIALLKAYKHGEAGDGERADSCNKEAERIAEQGDALFSAIARGEIMPWVHEHNRFHDHHVAEGVGVDPVDSIMQCVCKLVNAHMNYWELQTKINEIKGQGWMETGSDITFVTLQRQIDLQNQDRNHYIQHGDELLCDLKRE